jgi:predicted DCC family thiol-disulfide oxidoreductase YuxK
MGSTILSTPSAGKRLVGEECEQDTSRVAGVEMMRKEHRAISDECLLVYDGRCRLCVTAKEGLERLGTQNETKVVRMIPYQSEKAREVLGATYRPGRPDVAFLVQPNGVIRQGLDAFLPLLPGLRGGRILATFLSIPLIKPLAYLLYRLVARYRYHLFGEVPLTAADDPAEK